MIESQNPVVFALIVMAKATDNKNISLNSFISEISSGNQ